MYANASMTILEFVMARWNDEMLDNLAEIVLGLAGRVSNLTEGVEELSESVSGLAQAFVAEHEESRQFRVETNKRFVDFLDRYDRDRLDYLEWKKETDQRFNNLLEEVRTSNRRIDRLES